MKLLGILFLLCVLTMPVVAQDHCRIMFYNVENLFDTADDPSTADDEFTPRGKKHWTKAKYTDKLLKIAEVIDSVGDKELPCIVGLAEVENRWVLEDLTQKTALADVLADKHIEANSDDFLDGHSRPPGYRCCFALPERLFRTFRNRFLALVISRRYHHPYPGYFVCFRGVGFGYPSFFCLPFPFDDRWREAKRVAQRTGSFDGTA